MGSIPDESPAHIWISPQHVSRELVVIPLDNDSGHLVAISAGRISTTRKPDLDVESQFFASGTDDSLLHWPLTSETASGPHRDFFPFEALLQDHTNGANTPQGGLRPSIRHRCEVGQSETAFEGAREASQSLIEVFDGKHADLFAPSGNCRSPIDSPLGLWGSQDLRLDVRSALHEIRRPVHDCGDPPVVPGQALPSAADLLCQSTRELEVQFVDGFLHQSRSVSGLQLADDILSQSTRNIELQLLEDAQGQPNRQSDPQAAKDNPSQSTRCIDVQVAVPDDLPGQSLCLRDFARGSIENLGQPLPFRDVVGGVVEELERVRGEVTGEVADARLCHSLPHRDKSWECLDDRLGHSSCPTNRDAELHEDQLSHALSLTDLGEGFVRDNSTKLPNEDQLSHTFRLQTLKRASSVITQFSCQMKTS
jgi:hypothetical protein